MKTITAFTPGHEQPSARFRIRQYLPLWADAGLDVTECIAESYPPPGLAKRMPWLAGVLAKRLSQVISARPSDMILFQRTLVSTLPTFEWLAPQPRLLDVDDAIWMNQRFGAVWRLARASDGIICGNDWLAEHFSRYCKRIHVVPTGVDVSRYLPIASDVRRLDRLQVGWIGTQGNLRYLQLIEPQLRIAMAQNTNWDLRIISSSLPILQSLPFNRVKFVPWAESSEVQDIQSLDIGLMPLIDSEWERGKCSFKMLQYMACGIPAVVSAVGMNKQVAAMGGAVEIERVDDWPDALLDLLRDEKKRKALGRQARAVVERRFATNILAHDLAAIFRSYL